MSKTVIGLFDTYEQAQRVVDDLTAAGFSRDDISVISNNSDARLGDQTTSRTTGTGNAGSVVGGAVGGAAEGAVIGGLTGLAAGLALLLIPGVGPIAAAGPLAAALSGAGLGAAGGGVIGALSRLGVPKEESAYYAEGIRRGGTLVSLTTSDARAQAAYDIIERHNPVDIDERAAYYRSSGFTDYNDNAPAYTPDQVRADREAYARYTAPAAAASSAATSTPMTTGSPDLNRTVEAGQEVRVPVVAEELAVGKRQVERGRARIHTVVQETPVQEQVTLREEHVNVDRRPVDRAVTDTDLSNAFQERTIEVTERAEVPVVAKEARVVEEVVINKEATERTETVQDTVRRTDVRVDEVGGTSVTGTETGQTVTSRTTDTTDVNRNVPR